MVVEIDSCSQRGKVGCVRQRGKFVAKIGTANNGTGRDTKVSIQSRCDSNYDNADRANGTPAGSGQGGKNDRCKKRKDVEVSRIDDL